MDIAPNDTRDTFELAQDAVLSTKETAAIIERIAASGFQEDAAILERHLKRLIASFERVKNKGRKFHFWKESLRSGT